ncbi:MAG TPA: 16S rRNA (cytosine(967)-C(5))-methyltransferase RsmB [Abditibacterium sp.]|jgi:16S rRNA (cytosine967-C5)-methyltransferase
MPDHPKTLARRAALRALVASEKPDFTPADFAGVEGGVRPFAREIYSNSLRHRARLDWTLGPLLSKSIEKLDAPVRAALRLALWEKIALETPDRALANEYTELMKGEKMKSATGFINALTRRLPSHWREAPKSEVQSLAIEFSHPQWIVKRYLERFGSEETAQILAANNQIAPSCLRANTLRVSRDELLAQIPDSSGGEWSPDAIYPAKGDATALSQWRNGEIIAQDEAAQLVSLLAAPKSGDFVVDAASAPGGKTTHLAQIMDDVGRILALDSAPPRLEMVKDNARRLGIGCIETRAGDFRVLAPELVSDGLLADLVLLDAPCLGTGTLRRRPDAKWRKTPAQLEELLQLQRELLDSAAILVKIGGALIYSTCSIEIEENQQQIEAFIKRFPNFEIEIAPAFLAGTATQEGFLNTFPHRHGCDGMFAAKLLRIR